MEHERISLTFGDAGENHVGNQMLGSKGSVGSGFKMTDLVLLKNYFDQKGMITELVNLGDKMDGVIEAGVLIIRNYLDISSQNTLYQDLKQLTWDSKYYDTRRSKVLNKHARSNLVFVDGVEQSAEYENKKGTIYDIQKIDTLKLLKIKFMKDLENGLADSDTSQIDYICEGNRYYDLNKCGIGYHGDAERTRVICMSLGANNYPMRWVWFKKFRPITEYLEVKLNSGDLYIMSEKAVGSDWKRSSIPTIRHAAGSYKYINLDKYN